MSRTKRISSLSLALLALLCLQTQALSLFDGHSLRNTIMNAYASTSGVIELQRDYYASDSRFYVEADLSYHPSNSSKPSNSTNTTKAVGTVKMMLSLTNSDSMLAADDCLSFSYYDCSQYSSCSQYTFGNTIDYPYLTTMTKAAKGDLILDYNYWSISSSYYFALAQTCWSNGVKGLGSDRYGIIGLATAGSAKDNFAQDKIFSIYMKPDLSRGKLLFKNDTSTYANSSEPVYTFYTNSTWQIPLYGSGVIQIGTSGASLSGYNLMFDINSDVIGLPYNAYINFLSVFSQKTGAKCGSDNYRPVCNYFGKVEDLPDITISFTKYNLTIPSAIYASTFIEGSSFYFNFKATDPGLSGQSYVTPSFKNSVILGAHFMKYYFLVFDASTTFNIVYLYKAKAKRDDPSNFNAFWIVVGALAAVCLIGICCYCAKKQKSLNKNSTTTATLNNTNVVYTAPLIYNQQGGGETYNYGGYNNGSQQPQGMYPNFNAQGGVYTGGYTQPQSQPQFQERAKQ